MTVLITPSCSSESLRGRGSLAGVHGDSSSAHRGARELIEIKKKYSALCVSEAVKPSLLGVSPLFGGVISFWSTHRIATCKTHPGVAWPAQDFMHRAPLTGWDGVLRRFLGLKPIRKIIKKAHKKKNESFKPSSCHQKLLLWGKKWLEMASTHGGGGGSRRTIASPLAPHGPAGLCRGQQSSDTMWKALPSVFTLGEFSGWKDFKSSRLRCGS